MMDSGIGGMFSGVQRLTLEDYKQVIELWNPPLAWAYDYPCEPRIRKIHINSYVIVLP
ncbi:MAG: hypothetical protein QXL94_06010 [Candidatus Parvarchaeum sp.]